MKKWLIIGAVIIGLLILFVSPYNGLVRSEEDVKRTWGDVETAYQRRSELIPNLVKTVQGAAEFEKSTLEAVMAARAKATQTTIDPANITPEKLAEFQQAQTGVSSALSRLLVTVERYPELKANQNFLKLQDELASTENQILTARTRFNEVVTPYNNKVRTFPTVITAKLFGFGEKPYFKSKEGAENAPEVNFDFK
ncbi:LemA family protein [Myroides sp. JBRI-B21084]|uniref:LemA family protein n=1 Tax=Myroides sp. JBRI-B21084 TaxID=3119977 RepID=UPI0026E4898A|nr:LemA family protein [Paenimyroides cloacae]WKW47061.1 LemA family protein [Paenimyroides cloacae]